MAPALGSTPVRRPRIVPAIPHRLVRPLPSARPITPEESNKDTVLQPEIQAQVTPLVAADHPPDEQGARETPPTPDSRASVTAKSDADAPVLAHSPASSRHDGVNEVANAAAPLPLDTAPAPASVARSSSTASSNVQDVSADQPTTEASPAVNGLTDRSALPAELAASSHPSNKIDTGTFSAEGRGTPHNTSHRHQLSAGALVFRSANESPAQPATPQETELEPSAQEQHFSHPPPGLAPPLVTPYFHGPSHHGVDTGPAWLHPPPYPMAPLDATYEVGRDYQLPLNSNGPAYRGPYNEHISGAVASHSPSPNKSNFDEAKFDSDHGEEQRHVPYQNGTAPPTQRLDESPFELAAHLHTQFGNPEFADFILQVRSLESILVSIPVHGIVVVRSPVVAEAIRRIPASAHRSRDLRRLIDIHALDSFVTRESLEEAIKVLYGAPLLSPQTFLYGLGPYLYESDQAPPVSDARRRMQQVLSYIAAARSLQLPSMQARGVEIARVLLRWDTIDQVLHYGLQAGIISRSRADGPDTEDPFTGALLNFAIEFMAYSFPVDFKLYTIAPELQNVPRLPTFVDTRTPTHNPRLSKIRFGDAPPGDDLQPNHAARVLSSVLLSLPLPLIERIFNHRATANQIGWTGVVKVMRDVINERENRRQKALRGSPRPSYHGKIRSSLLNNLHIEERIEPSPHYPSGHRLTAKVLASDV